MRYFCIFKRDIAGQRSNSIWTQQSKPWTSLLSTQTTVLCGQNLHHFARMLHLLSPLIGSYTASSGSWVLKLHTHPSPWPHVHQSMCPHYYPGPEDQEVRGWGGRHHVVLLHNHLLSSPLKACVGEGLALSFTHASIRVISHAQSSSWPLTHLLAACRWTLRTEVAISLLYPFVSWLTLPEHGPCASVFLTLWINPTTCLSHVSACA